jgi:hypothetical protein
LALQFDEHRLFYNKKCASNLSQFSSIYPR